ncbi:MAG: hypothetical protein KC931_00415 [Candidatus Omnitrophica bacterium]|nr:hypothetical protein [Candidatus Omnitrophota bacterium]
MVDIDKRIESHLEATLERRGCDQFWREELADHLRESFEQCLAETSSEDEAWRLTLESAGDVRAVADELMDLHNPSAIDWLLRTLAVGAGILVFFWLTGFVGLMGLIDFTAALFVLGPAAVGVLLLNWPESPTTLSGAFANLKSHRVDWTSLRPYLRVGSIAGVIVGTAMALWRIDDPSTLGPALALAFISCLYGLILTTFSWPFLVGIFGALLVNWGILFAAFGWEQGSAVKHQSGIFLYAAIGTALTLVAAWFYYGRHEWFSRFRQLPVIAVIVTSILLLQNLQDPSQLRTMLFAVFSPVLVLYPLQLMVGLVSHSRGADRVRVPGS